MEAGQGILAAGRDLRLERRSVAVLEAAVVGLARGDARHPHHAAHGDELAAEGGEEREEGEPRGERILGRTQQAAEPVEGLAAAAGRDGVEELPDVLLAAVLDRALDEPPVDLAFREIGELAVLRGETRRRIRVDAAGRPSPVIALLAQ